MGTKGRQIIGKDVDKIIEMLNKALADEWLAYYQYWIGAKVAEGILREPVVAELVQHAADELRHAGLVADRIVQLGGTPLLEPKDWYEHTNCGYDAPVNPKVDAILEQNIKGERCAIDVYKALADFTQKSDPITYEMALAILKDEIEHEDDLEMIQNDLKVSSCKF